MKKYKLLKDLPNCKAGIVLFATDGERCVDLNIHPASYPDWFEEVKELEYTEDDLYSFADFINSQYNKHRPTYMTQTLVSSWLEKRKSKTI